MLPFLKYHGLENDFVLLDRLRDGQRISPRDAVWLCDRHQGVGADGVLSVLPSTLAPFRMHIFNADGSEAEMCGNGIRCVAKYLIDHKMVPGPVLRIETGAGVKECQVQRGPDGSVESVTVDMGAALFARERIPMRGHGEFVGETIEAGGKRFQGTAVSMGNPHLVLFAGADLGLAEHFGPLLEHHPDFPERTNVGFARATRRDTLELVVYERGSGITRACGTGACAATAAGVRMSLLDSESEVQVNLPGGTLHIRVAKDFSHVWMRGPATLAFRGETATKP